MGTKTNPCKIYIYILTVGHSFSILKKSKISISVG